VVPFQLTTTVSPAIFASSLGSSEVLLKLIPSGAASVIASLKLLAFTTRFTDVYSGSITIDLTFESKVGSGYSNISQLSINALVPVHCQLLKNITRTSPITAPVVKVKSIGFHSP